MDDGIVDTGGVIRVRLQPFDLKAELVRVRPVIIAFTESDIFAAGLGY